MDGFCYFQPKNDICLYVNLRPFWAKYANLKLCDIKIVIQIGLQKDFETIV